MVYRGTRGSTDALQWSAGAFDGSTDVLGGSREALQWSAEALGGSTETP